MFIPPLWSSFVNYVNSRYAPVRATIVQSSLTIGAVKGYNMTEVSTLARGLQILIFSTRRGMA